MSILIAYVTKYGFTKACAEMLAKKFDEKIDICDLSINCPNLSHYDKVIIGGIQMKKILVVILVLSLSITLLGFTMGNYVVESQPNKQLQSKSPATANSETEIKAVFRAYETDKVINYINTKYGFRFSLPESWKGYKIIYGKWEGLPVDNSLQKKGVITGMMISIRHPKWTTKAQRQDIPIMIISKEQWNLLKQDKYHIGAAPIGPEELNHNGRYIFALPARYNFAFPIGYEEVENIINNKPLHPILKNRRIEEGTK